MMKAVEDIKWLSERLSGLIALAPDLLTYDQLRTQITEMTNQVEEKKAAHQSFLDKIVSAKDEIVSIAKKGEDIIANAIAEGKKEIEAARAAADVLRTEAQSQFETMKDVLEGKLLSIQNDISEHQKTLLDLKDAVAQTQSRRDALQKEITDLKARF
jgi:chromosome segregation ATPase